MKKRNGYAEEQQFGTEANKKIERKKRRRRKNNNNKNDGAETKLYGLTICLNTVIRVGK